MRVCVCVCMRERERARMALWIQSVAEVSRIRTVPRIPLSFGRESLAKGGRRRAKRREKGLVFLSRWTLVLPIRGMLLKRAPNISGMFLGPRHENIHINRLYLSFLFDKKQTDHIWWNINILLNAIRTWLKIVLWFVRNNRENKVSRGELWVIARWKEEKEINEMDPAVIARVKKHLVVSSLLNVWENLFFYCIHRASPCRTKASIFVSRILSWTAALEPRRSKIVNTRTPGGGRVCSPTISFQT